MKIIRIVLLFYNSILVFTLLTVGFATNSYQDLTPTILLLPVGIYFAISLANQIAVTAHFVKTPSINRLKKILQIYSLIIILLLVFANLSASPNPTQATLILFFLPFIASFWFDISDKKAINQFRLKKIIAINKSAHSEKNIAQPSQKLVVEPKPELAPAPRVSNLEKNDLDIVEQVGENSAIEPVEEGVVGEEVEDLFDIKDQKRRQFLKIVGGGGVSMFLMLFVFQQKASAAFFGSAPGPGVVGIKDSDGNKIDPAEKQPTDGYSISEVDDSTLPSYYGFVHKDGPWYIAKENSSGAYRYVSGSGSFSTNWTNRASLTYDYFDNIF